MGKWSSLGLFRAKTSAFMHGFQNNLAQVVLLEDSKWCHLKDLFR